MSLYALEDLDDALDATRAFLLPFDAGRWARLALVALFAGGVGPGSAPVQFNAPSTPGGPLPAEPTLPDPGPRVLLLAAAAVAVVLALGLAAAFVGSVMEFVLVGALRSGEVAIRRGWSRHWRRGARLFGFRLAVGLVGLAVFLALAGAVLFPALAGSPGGSVLAVVALLPVLFAVAVAFGLVYGFTTAFVVPIMLLEGDGVLSAWRRLWASIRSAPWQFLAYAVGAFVLSIAGGIVAGMATLVLALLLLVPFGILGAVGFVLLGAGGPVGIALLAVAGLLFGLSVLAAFAVAGMPVTVYLRYYALFVLGDVDPDLDVIPGRREAVRGG